MQNRSSMYAQKVTRLIGTQTCQLSTVFTNPIRNEHQLLYDVLYTVNLQCLWAECLQHKIESASVSGAAHDDEPRDRRIPQRPLCRRVQCSQQASHLNIAAVG